MITFLVLVPRFRTNVFFATRALIGARHRADVAVAGIADARSTDRIDIRADFPPSEMAGIDASHDIRVRPSVGGPPGATTLGGNPGSARMSDAARRFAATELPPARYVARTERCRNAPKGAARPVPKPRLSPTARTHP
ncbi:hypothetical protein [uncultured Jannaschia sp.]|uniref:hypothetical protein n=1 Tax=uncultured Jannaschia sp. TaxID=293347 RepID=UPI00260F9A77|nr:hypothetical protein [uncultured Jannaschia sp.]